jgi:hypothetical protein
MTVRRMRKRLIASDSRKGRSLNRGKALFSAIAVAGLMTACAKDETRSTWDFLCENERQYYVVKGPDIVTREKSVKSVEVMRFREKTIDRIRKLDVAIIRGRDELKALANGDDCLSSGSVRTEGAEAARSDGIERLEGMVAQRERIRQKEGNGSFIIPVSELPPGTSSGTYGCGPSGGIWTGVFVRGQLFCR